MYKLNSHQIQILAHKLITQTTDHDYKHKLHLMYSYAHYFPLTKISRNTISSSQLITKFMNQAGLDLTPISCLQLGNLKTIHQLMFK